MKAIARERCYDDKSAVRRNGLQLLESVMLLQPMLPSHMRAAGQPEDVQAIEEATASPYVGYRQPAVAC